MYQMKVEEIVTHYRDISEELTREGYDLEQRASLLGKSSLTLKHFGGDADKKHWRLIPAEDLDRLRDKAIGLYWEAAEMPYRAEKSAAAEAAGDHSYVTPSYIALDFTGRMCVRHPHPIYCQEVADMNWGSVINTSGEPQKFDLDPKAELRSQWRRLVAEIVKTAGVTFREAAVELMCEVANVCRYSFWRVGIEHQRWRIQPTSRMIDALHAMGREDE